MAHCALAVFSAGVAGAWAAALVRRCCAYRRVHLGEPRTVVTIAIRPQCSTMRCTGGATQCCQVQQASNTCGRCDAPSELAIAFFIILVGSGVNMAAAAALVADHNPMESQQTGQYTCQAAGRRRPRGFGREFRRVLAFCSACFGHAARFHWAPTLRRAHGRAARMLHWSKMVQ